MGVGVIGSIGVKVGVGVGVNVGVNVFLGVGVGVGVAVGIGCAQQSATPVPGCRQYVSPLKQLVRLAQVNPVPQAGSVGVGVGVGVFAVPPQELGTVVQVLSLGLHPSVCVDEQEPARQT